MNRRIKLTLATICGASLLAGGVAYAAPRIDHGVQLPTITPAATTGVVKQTEYVPITPCRIIDTRSATAGSLKANVTRAFVVGGTAGFPAQGGVSGGCGIPAGATAIAASLSATNIAGTGIIHAWPSNVAEPNATVVNFNKTAGSVTTGATLSLNPAAAAGLDVKARGANTDFVVDVMGYYREPITATINDDGTLVSHSSQVTSTGRNPGNDTGVYVLNFDQSITGCSIGAIPATTSTLLITAFSNTATSVLIIVRNPTNSALVDSGVSVSVTC